MLILNMKISSNNFQKTLCHQAISIKRKQEYIFTNFVTGLVFQEVKF